MFSTPEFGNDRADWEARVAVWRDGRAVIGASDAGAHLDLLATFNYTTTTLAKAVREHEVLPLEEAVQLLTDVPARALRPARSGPHRRPAPTPTSSSSTPRRSGRARSSRRTDLPTGAARVYGEAEGIDQVIVNGARHRRARRVHRRATGHVAALRPRHRDSGSQLTATGAFVVTADGRIR